MSVWVVLDDDDVDLDDDDGLDGDLRLVLVVSGLVLVILDSINWIVIFYTLVFGSSIDSMLACLLAS